MVKQMKLSFASLLGAVALMAGCTDDDFGKRRPAVQGDEVHFGASAYFEQAPTRSSRTEYGDIASGKVELKWVAGDKLDIACPQATAGRRKAAYEVVTTSILPDNNATSADNSVATELQKLGEYGIQWGEPGVHNFYATYPSSQSFTDAERGKIGLDGTGLNGYLPVEQNPVGKEVKGDVTVLKPDMRYAFMVSGDASYDSSVEGGEGVKLTFKPLVTALEFQVAGPKITDNTTGGEQITVTEVSLYSYSSQNICGNFQYKFANKTLTETNEETGYSRITMAMPEGGLTLTNSTKMDFTFFVLPTAATIASKDLKLQIFYTYNGSPFVKTLTVAKEIVAKKKYFFKNITLPAFSANIDGSSWFSALSPSIYLSQVSIPVAGHTFSKYYSGTNANYYQEQTLDYTELWNKGVRGFEFCTSYNGTTSGSLDSCNFVCNATALTNTVNFGQAFSKLAAQLDKEGFKKECLIIIATYKSYTGGGDYSPQRYVTQLENFLKKDKYKSIADKLVKLTPQSTVHDLQGKIAIIVRPGDDAYQSTQNLTVTNNKLTLVKDWGTAVDKWDKRFGSEYKSEGAFNNNPATATKTVEDYLWGVANTSSSDTEFTIGSYGRDFDSKYPSDNVANYIFDHSTETSGQIVHVQEWARIVPQSFSGKFKSDLSDSHTQVIPPYKTERFYLWLNWPESYTQKQNMIKKTVEKSMNTKGGSADNRIFINSLCGYYPTTNVSASYYPYNTEYSYHANVFAGRTISFTLSNAGAGGDYVTCAYDLNKWFYNWLTTENTQQGPLGLVMLNHIGTTAKGTDDKSLDLVRWIMMNNFKFPLATIPVVNMADTSVDPSLVIE